ncbi:MAG: AMP-binding protein, partial [Desulfobacteraceae bacterium]|nr:AMP-binding protein [Desulfobacteraceae bacterium]
MTSQQDIQSQLVIGEARARAARKFPDMEALVFRDKRMTYRQFDEQVNRLANAL